MLSQQSLRSEKITENLFSDESRNESMVTEADQKI